jgi:hypothetical protein
MSNRSSLEYIVLLFIPVFGFVGRRPNAVATGPVAVGPNELEAFADAFVCQARRME